MPSTTYMVVDPRRDHSLRVPRPDLSDALATPNPCTGCHTTMTNRWASRKIQDWRGSAPPPEPHWGEALNAGRSGDADAGAKLAQLISSSRNPAIARASAVSLFPRYADRDGLGVVAAALRDPEPLVRAAALGALEGTEPELRLRLVVPLLGDPIRTVRFEAARVSADLPREQLAEADRQRLDSVLLEYRAAQRMDADRPDAQMRLAILELQQGKPDAAKSALERAIALDPSFIPAYVNLADFHRAVGDDAAGERVLRDALARAPQHPDVHHALGLALVRQGRLDAAIPELQRAAELRPEMPRYAFIWAVALHESGDLAGAKRVLGEAAARHPGDPQIRGFLQQLQARQP